MTLNNQVNEEYKKLSDYCEFVLSKSSAAKFHSQFNSQNFWNMQSIKGFIKYAFEHPIKLSKTIYLENKMYHVNNTNALDFYIMK